MVILNLGGIGEVEGAINLNDLSAEFTTKEAIQKRGVLSLGSMLAIPLKNNPLIT